VTARTSVDTTLITVGDRVRMTVTIDHPANASVIWPDSLDVSPFEVLAAQAEPVQTTGDRARSTAHFSMSAFELGELEIPSFDIDVLMPDGGRETVSTDRFGVQVVSVGTDDGDDIRDIRGPFAIAISIWRVAVWLLLAALLTAAAFAAYRRFRPKPVAPVVAGPPPRPPHEIALEALARLESSQMPERGEVKEFHIAVSEVLRRYVEARFAVPALELTTGEVIDGLEKAGVDAEFRAGFRGFLNRCDMVKFAKVRPDAATSREVLQLGRSLVEEARPA
jgi:hypothetical protein